MHSHAPGARGAPGMRRAAARLAPKPFAGATTRARPFEQRGDARAPFEHRGGADAPRAARGNPFDRALPVRDGAPRSGAAGADGSFKPRGKPAQRPRPGGYSR